ncbi:a10b265c-8309-4604-9fbd-c5c4edfe3d6a [Thermothielavioides terrestris]|uniref:Uncharacterized protein n=2 Tax=Thermothielavioides terrestris TaxID=2587410 RepID=G2R6A2_THETT|nr:uncharacterized protein THITE_2117974 [Thermothielavioides terrestris NRRL 8126]AEO68435.1 hypothetical protein THITE_2117974 [Thermothielavioides terrestris NRRL 8126]SPQ24295.1 a10b265c-8309-4604-9fbd-c5c4edfe3d6a [Thermothielavioides terrestris]
MAAAAVQVPVAHLYNTLPTLGDADARFVEREPVFKQLAKLLAQYNNVFGICLVHSHCKLDDTEIMLSKGNVSQPERLENIERFYPERWLANGTPYEFTTRQTEEPPRDLVDKFLDITRQFNLQDILGFYHIEGGKDAPALIEWTEGRKNLTRILTEEDKPAEPVQTAWDFGRGDPITMACTIVCDTRTTRSGNANTHKNTQSHHK